METVLLYIKDEQDEKLQLAADIIKRGGIVAFPTETVYGLGGNALDDTVVSKIYQAKNRPSDNPLIVHFASVDDIDDYVEFNDVAKKLSDAFWPGPFTMILKNKQKVSKKVSAGLSTLAVRVPSHRIAKKLIELSGVPIAAPSANLSGKPSSTHSKHVIADLMGRVDCIIAYDSKEVGLESTILDLTIEPAILLRPGFVKVSMIEEIIGKINLDKSLDGFTDKPRAPGMKYKHYSPSAEVFVLSGEYDKIIRRIITFISENNSKKIGIMCSDELKSVILDNEIKCHDIISLGSLNNLDEIGSNLFNTLREFDDLGVDIIIAEGYHKNDQSLAIMNRLNKASGYKILNL